MTYKEAYDYLSRAYTHQNRVDDIDFFTDGSIIIALVERKIPRIDIFSHQTNNSVQLRLDDGTDLMQMLRSIRVARSIVL